MLGKVFGLLLILVVPALAQIPATIQSTSLKLHAEAVASDEVDLHWYDNLGAIKRYLIQRSDDNGKTWHTIGSEEGGGTTGPLYKHNDTTKVEEQTHYVYRLETPLEQVL